MINIQVILDNNLTQKEIVQFWYNVEQHRCIGDVPLEEEDYFDLNHLIQSAFVWAETPQGNEYWKGIAER